ncbi:DUF2513 domain-containing protein [Faecalimicrobium sp. JNUCC 81]
MIKYSWKEGDFLILNPDCVRDILLTIEAGNLGDYWNVKKLASKISYSEDEIHYCCLKLGEAGFIDIETLPQRGTYIKGITSIHDLTFYGHEFLENIKNDNTWNKTKDIAKSVGSFSINALKDISASVISNLITAQFQ